MTDQIDPSELGAFTNNLPNKEGIKKLVDKVNSAGPTYTAGDNVQISDENVISATDTKYTAGDNVAISEQNVISATDTTYTAGTGISISEQNVISASGGGDWTLRTANNDWSDLFDVDDQDYLIAKKDIYMCYTNEEGSEVFIPKGYRAYAVIVDIAIRSPLIDTSWNAIYLSDRVAITKSKIPDSVTTFPRSRTGVKFTFDGTNQAISLSEVSSSLSAYKSSFKIYTK